MDRQELLRQWHNGIRIAHVGHIESAKYFEKINLYLGIPSIILSTLVGTTVFASLGSSQEIYVQIAVGLMSLVAAVLSSLHTFLDYSERAEKHKQASVRYGELRRDIEQSLVEDLNEEKQSQIMKDFCAQWNALDTESPSVPDKIHSRALAKVLGTHKGTFKG